MTMVPPVSSVSRDRKIIAVSLLGVLASTYALYVEISAEHKPEFKAMCDINEYASCSRVLTSKYAKGFGILPIKSVPNCVFGTLYYCIMILLCTFDHPKVVRAQLGLSLMAAASSVYLAGLLIFVLKDVCVVCISTYVINAVIAALTYKKFKTLQQKRK